MGETYESVTVETKDHVAQVTLIGPGKGNAMGPCVLVGDAGGVRSAGRRPRCAGHRHHRLGQATSATASMCPRWAARSPRCWPTARWRAPRTDFHAEVLRMQKAINAVADCRTPTIASVHGWCIGGGVDLISAVDIRYASADAKFSVREVKLAIVADVGSLARLPLILERRPPARTGADRQGHRRGPRREDRVGQRRVRRRRRDAGGRPRHRRRDRRQSRR